MSHYYTKDGKPAHEGGLAVARAEGYFPSVTTIIKIINKEGINAYRVRQMMMAALTLPRMPGESDEDFIQRLDDDARQHSAAASDLGTIMHGAIQTYLDTGSFPVNRIPVPQRPVHAYIVEEMEKWNFAPVWTEVSFANLHLGIGGQVDLIGYANKTPVIWDFKTQDVKETLKSGLPKFRMYPEWAMQLAAYRHAIGQIPGMEAFKTAECYSLGISTNPENLGVKVKHWPETHPRYIDMKKAFRQFAAARSLYYEMHTLTPPPRIPITHSCNFELLDVA